MDAYEAWHSEILEAERDAQKMIDVEANQKATLVMLQEAIRLVEAGGVVSTATFVFHSNGAVSELANYTLVPIPHLMLSLDMIRTRILIGELQRSTTRQPKSES